MNANTANTENFAWVDALLQHHALQEQRDYEERAMEVEEVNPEWAEEDGSESDYEEEDANDDLGAAFLARPPPLTRNNACFLTMSIDELTGEVVVVEAEDQDDARFECKRQKIYDAYEPIPMEICGDSDDDILDEDEPLYPLRLFPEGDDFEVDADGDIIIERLPSGNTLVMNDDWLLSHRAREGMQMPGRYLADRLIPPSPLLRAQYTSWIGENGQWVYNSSNNKQYRDEDEDEDEDEDDDSMPDLVSDISDDEDLRVIT